MTTERTGAVDLLSLELDVEGVGGVPAPGQLYTEQRRRHLTQLPQHLAVVRPRRRLLTTCSKSGACSGTVKKTEQQCFKKTFKNALKHCSIQGSTNNGFLEHFQD